MFRQKKLFTDTNTLVGLKSMTHEIEIPETKSDNATALKEHERIRDVLTNIITLLKNRNPNKVAKETIYNSDDLFMIIFYDRLILNYKGRSAHSYSNDLNSVIEFYLIAREYGIYDRVIDILESFVLKII